MILCTESLFEFEYPSSFLKYFITIKSGIDKQFYTINEILCTLKTVIEKEKLYDNLNPSIIYCSEELEKSFNMKCIFKDQVRKLLASQLCCVISSSSSPEQLSKDDTNNKIKQIIEEISQNKITFYLKYNLLRVTEIIQPNSFVFTCSQIWKLINKYIKIYSATLLDNRNLKVVMCSENLLGIALGVNNFYYGQLGHLILNQLIPTHPT